MVNVPASFYEAVTYGIGVSDGDTTFRTVVSDHFVRVADGVLANERPAGSAAESLYQITAQ